MLAADVCKVCVNVRFAPVTVLLTGRLELTTPMSRCAAHTRAAQNGVAPEQVIGATGATSALALVLKALVGPGDEVLIEHPRFDLLPALARDAGATVTDLPRRAPDYRVDPDERAGTDECNHASRLLTNRAIHRECALRYMDCPSTIGAIHASVQARVHRGGEFSAGIGWRHRAQ